MPGMIGLACGEVGRTSDFTPSLLALQKPPGTVFMKASGLGPAIGFNHIARTFMKRPELEWLFLVNDDNLYPPDTLLRLLAHSTPVVGGYYLTRTIPFQPVAFDELMPDDSGWLRRYYPQNEDHGLKKIVATGDGCLLVRRCVFNAIPDPWWEYGGVVTDNCDHDVVFCQKIREAGFDIYLDVDLFVDHAVNFVVRPLRHEDGSWGAQLLQTPEKFICLPPARPAAEEQHG